MAATDIKQEALPDLDDLLQCPVCYEIPTGQIFQCNEGHHVCGRCKARLDLCPVCRSLFFGTRNYAMEELIASVRKLQAFKLGGKMTVTSGSGGSESTASAENSVAGGTLDGSIDEESNEDFPRPLALRAPSACSGMFRCLCCKNGKAERLPAARLLNHLRYFHAPELIEGKSENGEYVQAWQIPTLPGRIVIAVRVSDMGIFFLVIEISNNMHAWVSMAAAPWVALEFCYTITISGNDREAIFSDCVSSVRSCEGTLKKRGRCLFVNGQDVRALTATANVSGRLTLRRAPTDQLLQESRPRAVLRVANRSANEDSSVNADHNPEAIIARVFAIWNEADALRSEEQRARPQANGPVPLPRDPLPQEMRTANAEVPPPPVDDQPVPPEQPHLSRNARRRMRHRLLNALNATQPRANATQSTARQNGQAANDAPHRQNETVAVRAPPPPRPQSPPQRQQPAPAPAPAAVAAPAPAVGGPSNGVAHNGNRSQVNKKKRRHRR